MPDSTEYWELLLLEARSLLPAEVRSALRQHNRTILPEDVEDLSELISFLLLDDDYRRLKTYDPAKAKLRTWLRKIVRHEVSHFLQKRPPAEPIEDLAETQVSVTATQEEELLTKEERTLLDEAITQLTPHDQRIARLKLKGATDEEVAQIMNIKPRSAQQEWSKIGIKLKRRITENRGGKLCHVDELRKIFSLRRLQLG